ncbi:hypothetical protein KO481_10485 [Nocardia sp. NEAU-G5]|uniref:Asp23/Gls24 family envelope stress response protein n=1 Tax=Nocardia albiluteola TaxID=2842303 RepID=A0ABS6AWM9_9NOCA|nr:hypothetical protein [Nocardia albiluteola]MBU3061950.1 hypothetical protein [Nocardia albiluteola]
MTNATLSPPAIHRSVGTRLRGGGVITSVQDMVRALPAPILPGDTVRAATVGDLASVHVIDSRTVAVVARRDRHIQPIVARIAQHLPGLDVTVIRSAITVSIA